MAKELIIHDGNWTQFAVDPVVDGERKARGLIPRDYQKYPQGHYASAPSFNLPLIPKSEYSARIKERVIRKAQLSDIRLKGDGGRPIPSLDQGRKGYCWTHSTVQAIMMLRAWMNESYVPLSAYAVACIIKNFIDEGGWGALSLDFATTRGVPSQLFWPQQSMSRDYDNPATWENAALHKSVESWADLNASVYDRNLTFEQVATLLLTDTPVVADYNWWGHSVCLLDLVEVEPGSFGVRILNSWGDGWSDRGMGILQGNHAIPDGAVAPRATLPTDKAPRPNHPLAV